MVTSAPQSAPPKAGLLDRILTFFVLFFGWIGLDRIFERLNFLATHEPFWRVVLFGTAWAVLMVVFVPAFSRIKWKLGQRLRS